MLERAADTDHGETDAGEPESFSSGENEIAKPGGNKPEYEQRSRAKTFRQQTRRDLEAHHRAVVQASQDADLRVAEPKGLSQHG